MLQQWRMLLGVLTPRERRHVYLLLANTSVLGVLDVAGIASVMPFIAVVVDTSVIDTNTYLASAYRFLGFTHHKEFLYFLGLLSFILLVVSNGFSALDSWLTFRFCHLRQHDLCARLLDTYLRQPYLLFLRRSPSELHKVLMDEVDRVIVGTLMSTISLCTDTVAVFSILIVLFWVDPFVTVTALFSLSLVYGAIFLLIERRIAALGEDYIELTTDVAQRTREALDGAKEIKVLGRESAFVDRFSTPHLAASINSIRHHTLEMLPHHGLEVLAFGGIIAMTLYYLDRSEDSGEALSLISLYAFAAYRLIPTLKGIFDGFATMRYNAPAVEQVCSDFAQAEPPGRGNRDQGGEPLTMERALDVRGLRFKYPGARSYAVDGLDMTIEAGAITCIMGPTGAGKSTAIDLLLGLLEAEQGQIRVDDTAIDHTNVRRWQDSIGYVPQAIYLTDDTITRNIALGLRDEDIDQRRVAAAATAAEIHDFISKELDAGYQTVVGDRGIRLSGGQRQRIGIARALYHQAPVLVLDEATNALDRDTEDRILTNLVELSPSPTIIFVTHRSSVARRSKRILVLVEGRLDAQGSHDELLQNHRFRSLLIDAD